MKKNKITLLLILIFILNNTFIYSQTDIAFNKYSTASQTSSGGSPNAAFDNNENTSWNSGGYAPAWIAVDLGEISDVTKIQLKVGQSPSGNTNHQIYKSDDMVNWQLIDEISSYTSNNQTIERNLNIKARGIKILTTQSPSWICWVDIKIFGNDKVGNNKIIAKNSNASKGNTKTKTAITNSTKVNKKSFFQEESDQKKNIYEKVINKIASGEVEVGKLEGVTCFRFKLDDGYNYYLIYSDFDNLGRITDLYRLGKTDKNGKKEPLKKAVYLNGTKIVDFGEYKHDIIYKTLDSNRYFLVINDENKAGIYDLTNRKELFEIDKFIEIKALSDTKQIMLENGTDIAELDSDNSILLISNRENKKYKLYNAKTDEITDSSQIDLENSNSSADNTSSNSNCENIQVPDYTVGEWRNETFGSGQWTTVFIGGYSSTFYYKESLTGKNYYSHGCNGEWYDTLENAIRAYYLCAKCGIVSEKGRL